MIIGIQKQYLRFEKQIIKSTQKKETTVKTRIPPLLKILFMYFHFPLLFPFQMDIKKFSFLYIKIIKSYLATEDDDLSMFVRRKYLQRKSCYFHQWNPILFLKINI